MSHYTVATCPKHTAVSREVVGRNVHETIPKGNMGYDRINTLSLTTEAVEPTFVDFL